MAAFHRAIYVPKHPIRGGDCLNFHRVLALVAILDYVLKPIVAETGDLNKGPVYKPNAVA